MVSHIVRGAAGQFDLYVASVALEQTHWCLASRLGRITLFCHCADFFGAFAIGELICIYCVEMVRGAVRHFNLLSYGHPI